MVFLAFINGKSKQQNKKIVFGYDKKLIQIQFKIYENQSQGRILKVIEEIFFFLTISLLITNQIFTIIKYLNNVHTKVIIFIHNKQSVSINSNNTMYKYAKNDPEFEFQYILNQANTLTMTRPLKRLSNLIFRKPHYILIDKSFADNDENTLKFKKHLFTSLTCFKNSQGASAYIHETGYQNLSILCSVNEATDIQKIFRKQIKVECIYCYGSVSQFQKLKKLNMIGIKFKKRTDKLEELIKHLIRQNGPKVYSLNQFMTFVPVENQTSDLQMLIRSMYAMINQKTNSLKLVDQMVKLANITKNIREQQLKQFVSQLNKYQPKAETLVSYYRERSSIYRLLNIMLMSATHPSQVYFFQPFIKLLYQSISQLHRNDRSRTFYCYIGSFANERQLKYLKKSIGSLVQNSIFIEASTNKQAEEELARNVFFQVKVESSYYQQNGFVCFPLNRGYSSYYSSYYYEGQVLFNPLNFFQIESSNYKIIEGREILVVSLLYPPQKKHESQINFYKKDMQLIKSIGDVLVHEGQNMLGSALYWSQHKKLCANADDLKKNLEKFGQMYMNQENYQKAKLPLEQREKNYFEGDLQSIKNKETLAKVYMLLGQYQKSIQYYEKVEYLYRNKIGAEHPNYMQTIRTMGELYLMVEQYKKSLQFFNKSLEIYRRKFGIESSDYIEVLKDVALAHEGMGQLEKSKQLYIKCQQISRKTVGIDHPNYLDALRGIGMIYLKMKDYEKSLQFLEKCEKIQRLQANKDLESYSITLSNIGLVYLSMKNYKTSLQRFKQSEKIKIEIEAKNQSYANILNNIGGIYSHMGQYQKSIQHYKKCEQILSKLGQSNLPSYIAVLKNIGSSYLSMKNVKMSQTYLKKAKELESIKTQ